METTQLIFQSLLEYANTMKTSSNPPVTTLLLYLIIALAPTWLDDGTSAALVAVSVYGACLFWLSIAASDSGERKNMEHPVQAGKTPLIRGRGRLIAGHV
jgi:hypothetical protein